jgi:hypothetical protein
VFNYFLISIVIAPLLVGVASAARERDGRRSQSTLSAGWLVYVLLWFGVLYLLRYKWA